MNETFFAVFSAVLAANLLTLSFVWGAVVYSRRERDGEAGKRGTNRYALAMIAPVLVLAVTTMIALDRVPAWLDSALR